jgi:hypothetical protein
MNTPTPDIINNPSIRRLGQFEDQKRKMLSVIAEQLIMSKGWSQMSDKEQEVCMGHVVGLAENEADLRNRLCELGLEYFEVSWTDVDSGDKSSLEAQMLVKALGGLSSKNGAFVIVMTVEKMFT